MTFTDSDIAQVCHEVQRSLKAFLNEEVPAPWYEAPPDMRSSCLSGVEHALNQLDLGEPVTPESSHEAWRRHKEAQGWRYGPKNDPERKEHPCMVPYVELPFPQRLKDVIYVATIKALHECWDGVGSDAGAGAGAGANTDAANADPQSQTEDWAVQAIMAVAPPGTPPHVHRLVRELVRLSGNLSRLHEFMIGPVYPTLPIDEQARLRAQKFHMQLYRDILRERLRFGGVNAL